MNMNIMHFMHKLCTNYALYALIMQNCAEFMHITQNDAKLELRKNYAKITQKITHTCVICIICIIVHPLLCCRGDSDASTALRLAA